MFSEPSSSKPNILQCIRSVTMYAGVTVKNNSPWTAQRTTEKIDDDVALKDGDIVGNGINRVAIPADHSGTFGRGRQNRRLEGIRIVSDTVSDCAEVSKIESRRTCDGFKF